MKRDADLLRQIVLEVENGKTSFEPISTGVRDILQLPNSGPSMTQDEAAKLEHHLSLVEEAGYVEFQRYASGEWMVNRMTGKGHDFPDSVRDPAIWAKTKTAATAAGGFTLELLGSLAKGFLKTQIEQRTGMKLDL